MRASKSETPILPTASARLPVRWASACMIWANIPVVVVLPLVPVTTSQVRGAPKTPARSRRYASSTSPITSTPASWRATNKGESGRQPGEVTTRSKSPWAAESTETVATPNSSANSASAVWLESATVVSTPRLASIATQPRPDTPAPATSTRPRNEDGNSVISIPLSSIKLKGVSLRTQIRRQTASRRRRCIRRQ